MNSYTATLRSHTVKVYANNPKVAQLAAARYLHTTRPVVVRPVKG